MFALWHFSTSQGIQDGIFPVVSLLIPLMNNQVVSLEEQMVVCMA